MNDAPTANNDIQTATGTEDTTLLISVLSNDTDTDHLLSELTITGLTQPLTGGTLTTSGTTQVRYTPDANFCTSTPLTFTYQAIDASGSLSSTATGSFVVTCVNDTPVALDDLDGTMRNTSVLIDVLSNDTDSDNIASELSITGITSAVLGTPVIQSGRVLYTPFVGLCGTGSFDYQTEDSSNALSPPATVLITINCINDAPVATNDTETVSEDSLSNIFTPLANDTDTDGGDILSISGIVTTPSNGTLTTSGTTELVYTPDTNFCGTDVFTYQAQDSF